MSGIVACPAGEIATRPAGELATADGFARSRQHVEDVLGWLEGESAATLSAAEVEEQLQISGRELLRQFLSDHFELRALREQRLPAEQVVDAEGRPRGAAEAGHQRELATVFGPVPVRRIAYRAPGRANLYPADGVGNLPREKHSHGLRRLAAIESTRGSFDDAMAAINRASGQQVGKRQVEQLATRAAADVDAFYRDRQPLPGQSTDTLVLTCDGKGVVMRPDALRPATAAAAAAASPKMSARVSKGEKRNRKRMAEVGSVYDAAPAVRSRADILPDSDQQRANAAPGPRARHKWLHASLIDDTATVIDDLFGEAERRDPAHQRSWVALVDGNNHQIDRVTTEAHTRGVRVPIVIDFIHALEYIWTAAWSFHHEGDPAAQDWVRDKASAVLEGKARQVATGIRRRATRDKLSTTRRKGADTCADYLTSKADHLDYPTALRHGWPIATGVIEGACRHLIKDRMDLTGARWGLPGAEAILKLRAVASNGDWDAYWTYHLRQERQRIHLSRYANQAIPQAP